MNILVLEGGDSSEREVSLRSAAAVATGLRRAGHTVSTFDTVLGIDSIVDHAHGVDMVFPILHGDNGEDGVVQEVLERAKIPFLGTGSASSRICINKAKTHEILEAKGVRMARFEIVTSESFLRSELIKKPFVLKTIDGGSSVDIVISRELLKNDMQLAKKLLTKRGTMLLEELIEGQEITVPVLDEEALPIIAITPPAEGEFDYENKYNGKTTEICPVPDDMIPEATQREAQELALKVHKALGARHLSRTDMIMTANGELFVLELNTIPGMTDQSLYPKAALTAGITMVELVDRFVKLVASE